METDDYVEEVLEELKDKNGNIHKKKLMLDAFLAAVRGKMKNEDCEIINSSSFIHTGSSYENTAVEDDADFDMLMILPKPYSGVNFQAVESNVHGYFKLQWIDSEDSWEECHFSEADNEDLYFSGDNNEESAYYEYDNEYSNFHEDDNEESDYSEDDNEESDYSEDDNEESDYSEDDNEESDYSEDDNEESDYSEDDNEDSNFSEDDNDLPKFVRSDGILKAKKLLDYVFGKLSSVLRQVKEDYPEWNLRYRIQHSSIIINLVDSDGDELKVDVVPQIASRNWNLLPRVCMINDLPAPIQQCVENQHFQYPILWSLVPAPFLMDEPEGDCLVTTAFSLLEKHFLKEPSVVKDAVILVKLVSVSRGWKRGFGLRPFHIKRVAMKYYNELLGLSSWKAFQRLLYHLSAELRDGMIDSFLIEGQDIFLKDQSVCYKLADQIDGAKIYVQPRNLVQCLEDDD